MENASSVKGLQLDKRCSLKIVHDEPQSQRMMDDFAYTTEVTPVQSQLQNEEGQSVGGKYHNLEEESRHSRWEEFRRFASRDNATEGCSTLLKRMELEASDNEDDMNMEDEMISLEEAGLIPSGEAEVLETDQVAVRKNQKRKTGWGPIQRIPRPRRVPDDGKYVLQRAQELKQVKNLEKGTRHSSSLAFASNTSLNIKAHTVGIELGMDDLAINNTIDGMKQKELDNLKNFEENNPEVNLPGDLNIDISFEDFPSLINKSISPVIDGRESSNQSWIQIVSKDNDPNNSKNVKNDRCILECERP
jgi:hypothetical protein